MIRNAYSWSHCSTSNESLGPPEPSFQSQPSDRSTARHNFRRDPLAFSSHPSQCSRAAHSTAPTQIGISALSTLSFGAERRPNLYYPSRDKCTSNLQKTACLARQPAQEL